ncbi:F420-0:gamma-glutamyl ligase [Rubrobacter radiotolerans]|uniref:Coenzyme F420-0:L-glutamate ligase n=2 Tax=Rubrobacter radiotolerans TaxID=42256 RepID=A0A023X269_RUBRA|nr:coenzyme F420-0:L-glutamate ligase [Rubrobacter radiotolerans]AHY46154.1 F420-0:gamma-glutamyl ligase [Rubrobacter radiotolerans]MDX5893564.1 coenzyme F420-0:L-glutamate ligase [Rubrobacter radiotolerans]SMC04003.1 coenzyme F420-0 gamma-glutamyl ligase [Rubrobacter radiotolerans DSM 5868]
MSEVRILPVTGMPEVRPGDDLEAALLGAAGRALRSGDVLVVTHKVVSKAEGRLVDLSGVTPSAFAREFAERTGKDARQVEVVLRESRRIVRMVGGLIIAETAHGFVCANAGVDASNVPGEDCVCLLPEDPDASARRIRAAVRERLGLSVAVVVTDSFGRPWRAGITNVAVGVAGMAPLLDYRGETDEHGYALEASVLAVADELAAASELVMNKVDAVPAAIVRGYRYVPAEGSSARELVMPPERDLFR